tara:strand:- start:839 stop:1141 length:303 start_codon:yes stop_codon:yes gene_type:complete
MRSRLMAADVYSNFGWDVDKTMEFQSKADVNANFQHLLFTRVMPNLSKIGLITDKVRPLYDELGVLDLESWPNDGEIDWVSLERPLDANEDSTEPEIIAI